MDRAADVTLIEHTPEHLRALLEGPEVYQQHSGRAVADGVRDFLCGPEVSDAFLARLRDATVRDPWRDGFGVVTENKLIGLCSFNGPPDEEGTVEISYGIALAYQGLGYATAAARLLIARAEISESVRGLRAYTLPQDNASTRILQKCGFRNCGEVFDEVDGRIWRWERVSRLLVRPN